MMQVQTKSLAWLVAVDMTLVTVACLIPAVSHLFALPLYMLNPMLALLLVGMALGRDWRNALPLAILMPLLSSLLTGMPAGGKVVCMMAELAVVAGLFHVLINRWNAVLSVFAAIFAGKVVYYLLKAFVLAPVALVGTEWWIQLCAVLLWGGLFAMIYKSRK